MHGISMKTALKCFLPKVYFHLFTVESDYTYLSINDPLTSNAERTALSYWRTVHFHWLGIGYLGTENNILTWCPVPTVYLLQKEDIGFSVATLKLQYLHF